MSNSELETDKASFLYEAYYSDQIHFLWVTNKSRNWDLFDRDSKHIQNWEGV